MMGKLLPIVLALAGLGGGVGAGIFLRPAAGDDHATAAAPDGHAADPAADPTGDHAAAGKVEAGHGEAAAEGDGDGDGHASGLPEYVKMNNQFVVPVVEEGRVTAMVVLSLSLEVTTGSTEAIYAREPRLRDAFLQVLFDHANVGGFSGSFTDGANLVVLRNSLKESAILTMGTVVTDVLITDIARQDG